MSAARENAQRCPAVKRNGSPCVAAAGADGWCIGHRPGAQDARRKGGAGTSRVARAGRLIPARLRPVAGQLERALEEVHAGKLDPRVGTAMAALAGALVRAITSGELEERLRVLERADRERA